METTTLPQLLDRLAKLASVTLSPRQQFTYIPLPEDLAKKWTEVQTRILPAGGTKQEIDHVTLVHVKKSPEDLPAGKVDEIVKALREVGEDHPSLHAKVQGWGYFDGAMNEGEKCTAVVALVDCPGIEDLQVAMKAALKQCGLKPSEDHAFNAHFTFCYLKEGGRLDTLPPLDGEFTVDRIIFANNDLHAIPLKGRVNIGVKAAKEALR